VSLGRLVKIALAFWVLRWLALELAAHHHRIARVLRA
jgi:hypothetical protein